MMLMRGSPAGGGVGNGAPRDGGAVSGQLLVRGPGLFQEYFGRPDATAAAFDEDGFFRTGDTVARSADGVFRILGRTSVDIFKVITIQS